MSFKNSCDKILFAFDSRVVIKMIEREQRGLMQVGIMDHNGTVFHLYAVKLQETKPQTHRNNRLYFGAC